MCQPNYRNVPGTGSAAHTAKGGVGDPWEAGTAVPRVPQGCRAVSTVLGTINMSEHKSLYALAGSNPFPHPSLGCHSIPLAKLLMALRFLSLWIKRFCH